MDAQKAFERIWNNINILLGLRSSEVNAGWFLRPHPPRFVAVGVELETTQEKADELHRRLEAVGALGCEPTEDGGAVRFSWGATMGDEYAARFLRHLLESHLQVCTANVKYCAGPEYILPESNSEPGDTEGQT